MGLFLFVKYYAIDLKKCPIEVQADDKYWKNTSETVNLFINFLSEMKQYESFWREETNCKSLERLFFV